MTTSQGSEYRNDSFPFWGTDVLMSICFRVTPVHEQGNWVITSRIFRFDENGQELYDREALRAFAVEQLEDYGITEADVNRMKS